MECIAISSLFNRDAGKTVRRNPAVSQHPWKMLPFLFALSLLCGCANLTEPPHENAEAQTGCNCAPEDLNTDQQRKILNEGYSLLHQDATKLNLTDLLLHVKAESDSLKRVINDVSAFARTVEKDLERIERDYPAVNIHLDPLPVMEKRKRWSVGQDRAIDFAPVVGRGGRDYERTLLISFQNGINHQRHLCKVMVKEEPVESLKQFLSDTEQGYEKLYRRIEALLSEEYFLN